jgi:hypothetical protein
MQQEALPSFIREKMQSSDEFKGRIKHAENMRGGASLVCLSYKDRLIGG